jgi:hypothetical protein
MWCDKVVRKRIKVGLYTLTAKTRTWRKLLGILVTQTQLEIHLTALYRFFFFFLEFAIWNLKKKSEVMKFSGR